MKSISYLVLIVSGLMVAASIDTVPDPPAVRSDTANVKAPCLREVVVAFGEQRLTSDSACISPHVPRHLVSLPDATAPKRLSDWIALAGHAADPSPPVL